MQLSLAFLPEGRPSLRGISGAEALPHASPSICPGVYGISPVHAAMSDRLLLLQAPS